MNGNLKSALILFGIFILLLGFVFWALAETAPKNGCPPGAKLEWGQYIGWVCVIPPSGEHQ